MLHPTRSGNPIRSQLAVHQGVCFGAHLHLYNVAVMPQGFVAKLLRRCLLEAVLPPGQVRSCSSSQLGCSLVIRTGQDTAKALHAYMLWCAAPGTCMMLLHTIQCNASLWPAVRLPHAAG
jgi:hypothetical protein